ncbi:MAG TPA: hypothetical protein VGD05_10895 [Pyrinomonadaceae bacterium]|jgi:hypothetical protein
MKKENERERVPRHYSINAQAERARKGGVLADNDSHNGEKFSIILQN